MNVPVSPPLTAEQFVRLELAKVLIGCKFIDPLDPLGLLDAMATKVMGCALTSNRTRPPRYPRSNVPPAATSREEIAALLTGKDVPDPDNRGNVTPTQLLCTACNGNGDVAGGFFGRRKCVICSGTGAIQGS